MRKAARSSPSVCPRSDPTPLQGVFIYLSVIVLVCGVIAIVALELGTPMSSLVVKIPVLLGGSVLLAASPPTRSCACGARSGAWRLRRRRSRALPPRLGGRARGHARRRRRDHADRGDGLTACRSTTPAPRSPVDGFIDGAPSWMAEALRLLLPLRCGAVATAAVEGEDRAASPLPAPAGTSPTSTRGSS